MVREAGHPESGGSGPQWRRREEEEEAAMAGDPGRRPWEPGRPFHRTRSSRKHPLLPVSMAPGWPAGRLLRTCADRAPVEL